MQQDMHQEQNVNRGTIRAAVLAFLWVLTLFSGLAVVYSTYVSRIKTQELESLRREGLALKVSAGQYKLELSSLASYSRIETLAEAKLEMTPPEPSKTVLVPAQ
ncbi:cell division protein FtsL [Agaribacterium sp. ZY112]|uniref:cell division protein FtsL n=1 Tax=Agaribacterium sp. ZY112 TaxID=3233574 RepID=UPI0035237101